MSCITDTPSKQRIVELEQKIQGLLDKNRKLNIQIEKNNRKIREARKELMGLKGYKKIDEFLK